MAPYPDTIAGAGACLGHSAIAKRACSASKMYGAGMSSAKAFLLQEEFNALALLARRPNDTYRSHKAVEADDHLENVGMNVPRMITAATALGTALATATQAQLLTYRDLSYPMARTIAEAAIESCGAKGYRVSAVVVDRAGEVMVAMRADGAAPHTMENARRKAYTALSFRMSTTDYAKRYADNNPVVRQQVTLPNVIAIPGGLPVKVGEDVIAGVGVSGSPGVDEPCVQAGIDKVAAQLE